MFVNSPTASLISPFRSLISSPSILETIFRIAPLLKLSATEPTAAPVRPMMPETSPCATLSLFRYGFPARGSTKAIVLITLTVPSKKGLMNLTFMSSFLPAIESYGVSSFSMILLIFSFSTSAVNGLTI